MAQPDRSKWTPASEYQKWAQTGVNYTRTMLSNGPANQGFHPILRMELRVARWGYTNGSSPIDEATKTYDTAIKLKSGNCTEFASVAFIYLYRLGIRPLALFGYTRGSANHMMCAVGLDLSRANFTMGVPMQKLQGVDLSYICDPWKNVTYPGAIYSTKEPGIDEIQAYVD
jgi:hypothetical protein